MALQSSDKLGPYEILAPIGRGGIGRSVEGARPPPESRRGDQSFRSARNFSTASLSAIGLGLIIFVAYAQDASGGREQSGELSAFISRGTAAALSPRSSFVYEINKKTPTLPFKTGVSPVVLVKLPDFAGPYTVRVSTEFKGTSKLSLVVPIILFFDIDGHKTRMVDEEAFSLKYPSKWVEGEIPVSEANRQDRFLLIYTDASKIGETAGLLKTEINAGGRQSLTTFTIHRGLGGKVRLEVVK